MGFDLSWDTLAIMKGGMRIHYSGADPTRDRGCTELLPHIVVFKWNEQAESVLPKLWVLSHVSVIIPKCSDWAAPFALNRIYCRSNTKACSSLCLPTEAMASRKHCRSRHTPFVLEW